MPKNKKTRTEQPGKQNAPKLSDSELGKIVGGAPAPRLTDFHQCPMSTPSPVAIPHVGGPIVGPGAPTVLIGGLPAAKVGNLNIAPSQLIPEKKDEIQP